MRELANVIERAVRLGPRPSLTVEDLPSRVVGSNSRISSKGLSYRDAMEDARRELVAQALEQSRGNRAAAAKALGLHEKYLLRLIKSLGIN